jgi:predicted alpha/beta hydrolase family esterase
VRGALLVAPPDVERDDLRQQLPGWAPVAPALPFRSIVVASTDDPFGSFDRAAERARQWRSELRNIGPLRPHQRRLRPGRLARRPRWLLQSR